MPKPTLIQAILNRPSQTYYHPSERDYHSTRHELFRIANATKFIPGQFDDSGFDSSTPGNSDSEAQRSSATLDRPAQRPPSTRTPSVGASSGAAGVDATMIHSRHSSAQKRTLIHSIASSSSFVSFKNADSNSSHTRISSLNSSSRQSRSSRNPSSRGNEGDVEESSGEDDEDEGTDIFYTPRSSLASAPRMSHIPAAMLEPQALASALLHAKSNVPAPKPSNDDTSSVSRTPSDSSISSVASSTSAGDDVFSVPSQTPSTRPTTAVGSERGGKQPGDSVETITIATSSRPRTLSGAKSITSSPTSVRSTSSTIRKQAVEEARKLTYTDEDWAQDVRWLTPPRMPAAASPSARRHSRTLPPDFQLSVPSPEGSPPARRPGRSRPKGDRRSKRSRKSHGRMSALWEEDESEEASTGISSTEPSRSTTPIPETPPHSLPTSPLAKGATLPPQPDVQEENTPSESTHSESTPDARLQKYARGQRRTLPTGSSLFKPAVSSNANLPTHPLPNPVASSSTAGTSNGYTGLTLPHAGYSNAKGKAAAEGHVDLVRAGVAQSSMVTIEVIRGVASTISHGTVPTAAGSSSKPRKKSFSISLGRSFTLSLRSKKRESATPAHLQGSLPLPVAFTAHVAPPSYVPESHVLVQVHAVGLETLDSHIVYEKSGMGGSGGLNSGKGIGGGKAGFIPGRSFVGKVIECGWAVREEVCKRGEWVVGLLDVKKCGALAEFILVERHRVHRAPQPRARSATLFPPRRRAHLRSQSLPVNGHAYPNASSPLAPAPLSIEELALLPLCAIPAHRAVRTFSDVLAPPIGSKSGQTTRPDVRALVLRAHDGAGAVAVQMLTRRGIRVCVQVPESSMLEDEEAPPAPQSGRKLSVDVVLSSPTKNDKGKGKEGQKPTLSKRAQLEALLRAWGVEDICVGEPLDVLHQLAEDGQSFDMILDTVGGVAVWEASQKLLTMDWTVAASRSSASLGSRNGSIDLSRDPAAPSEPQTTKPSKTKNKSIITHAQFTTLVGDMPHRPVPTAQDNLRSGLRSLKRSMSTSSHTPKSTPAVLTKSGNKREKRVVGYAWVSVAADVDFEGEDVRDSLAAVMRMAEAGWLRAPCVTAEGDVDENKVVPFERAPEVFRRGVAAPLGMLADGGTCAVRIIG